MAPFLGRVATGMAIRDNSLRRTWLPTNSRSYSSNLRSEFVRLYNADLPFVRSVLAPIGRYRKYGEMLHDALGLNVERVAHGPHGGDLIIGGRVAEGKVEAVLFFRDPFDRAAARTRCIGADVSL